MSEGEVTANFIALLKQYDIPVERYGTGEAKSLEALAKKVAEGEYRLVDDSGELVRQFQAIGVNVIYSDGKDVYRLREAKQVFPDGREITRDLVGSMAGTIKPGEAPEDAAAREMEEELGFRSPLEFNPELSFHQIDIRASTPGIKADFDAFLFTTHISTEQYRPEGYVEKQAEKSTYFTWEKISQ